MVAVFIAVHKRVRSQVEFVQCGQEGRVVLQMRTFALFGSKPSFFFRNLWRVRTDKGEEFLQTRRRGQFCGNLCGRPLWTAPYIKTAVFF